MIIKTPDTNILISAAIIADTNRELNKRFGNDLLPTSIDSVLRSNTALFDNCELVYTSEVLREAPDVFRSRYPRLGGYVTRLVNSNPPTIYPSESTRNLMKEDRYYYRNDVLIYLICLDNNVDWLITNNAIDFKRLNWNKPDEFPAKFSIILSYKDLSGYNEKESMIVNKSEENESIKKGKNESYAHYILRWIKSLMID